MSGPDTDDTQEPGEDAGASVSPAGNTTFDDPASAAEAAEVPAFSVPDPVLPPDPVIPDPVLPPESVLPEPVLPPESVPPEPVLPPDPVAEDVVPSAPAAIAPNASSPDAFHQPPPGSYRGWTIAIFAGLAILFFGAVAGLFALAAYAPLSWPTSDSEQPVVETAVPEPPRPAETALADEPSTDQDPQVDQDSGRCAEFCADIADLVSDTVTGQDGTSWTRSHPWQSVEPAGAGAAETIVAEYSSTAGTATFTIWEFADDDAADEAFAEMSAQRGEPAESGTVYDSGAGVRNSYEDAGRSSILWSVTGDGDRPWVLLLDGPDDPAVFQLYLSLPI